MTESKSKPEAQPAEQDKDTDKTCPICHGVGIVIDGVSGAHTCSCQDNVMTAARLRNANIPPKYITRTFETFDPYSRPLRQMLDDARAYAAAFDSINKFEKKGLFLTGTVGSGKTHLAAAILQAVITSGHTGLFWNVVDLFRALRDTMSPDSPLTENDIIDRARSVDLLVLDDLGTEKTSEWVLDRLYMLINGRYQDDTALIITTNQTFPELTDRLGTPIVSRLSEMCSYLNVKADDYRRRNLK